MPPRCRQGTLPDLASLRTGSRFNTTLHDFRILSFLPFCMLPLYPFRSVLITSPPPPPQPDTALARPKFSLFKPSSELILKKIVDMRANGGSEPPPAICAVYRRGEAGTPSEQSPTRPR